MTQPLPLNISLTPPRYIMKFGEHSLQLTHTHIQPGCALTYPVGTQMKTFMIQLVRKANQLEAMQAQLVAADIPVPDMDAPEYDALMQDFIEFMRYRNAKRAVEQMVRTTSL